MPYTVLEPEVKPSSGGFTVLEPERPIQNLNQTKEQKLRKFKQHQEEASSPANPLVAKVLGALGQLNVEPFTAHGILSQPTRLLGMQDPDTASSLIGRTRIPGSETEGRVRGPQGPITQIASGVINPLLDLVSQATSPEGLLQLPALLNPLGRLAMAAPMAMEAPQQTAQNFAKAGAAPAQQDVGNVTQAGVQSLIQAILPVLIAKGVAPKLEVRGPVAEDTRTPLDRYEGYPKVPEERQLSETATPNLPPVSHDIVKQALDAILAQERAKTVRPSREVDQPTLSLNEDAVKQ